MLTSNYHTIRKDLKRGDLVLYHNGGIYGGIMGKLIQFFDDAHFTHIGIVDKFSDRVISLDMWQTGMEVEPISRRMKLWKEFVVLRPNTDDGDIDKAIDDLYRNVWERDVKYDKGTLLRIAIKKKTGIDLMKLGRADRYICSELAQHFTGNLGIKCYENLDIITPQDFIRHINLDEMEFVVH